MPKIEVPPKIFQEEYTDENGVNFSRRRLPRYYGEEKRLRRNAYFRKYLKSKREKEMRTSTWKKWLAEFKKTDHYEKATATEITQFLFKYWWDIFDKAQENDEALAQECAVQLRHLAALMQRIERGEDVKKEVFDPVDEDF